MNKSFKAVLIGAIIGCGAGVFSSAKTSVPQAILIVSNTCPCCLKLQKDQFSEKFKEKYKGKLVLKEYELHTPEGVKQARKYKIKGTPSLFIGGTEVQYSCHAEPFFQAIDQFLPGYLARRQAAAERAPKKDLLQMQQYIERVQNTNEQTVASITPLFSEQTVTQANALISANEKKLKNLATQSTSFQAFEKEAKRLETIQQMQLDQLLKTGGKSGK